MKLALYEYHIIIIIIINPHIDGILPKGPNPPCLRIADRALLAGHPRHVVYTAWDPAKSEYSSSAGKHLVPLTPDRHSGGEALSSSSWHLDGTLREQLPVRSRAGSEQVSFAVTGQSTGRPSATRVVLSTDRKQHATQCVWWEGRHRNHAVLPVMTLQTQDFKMATWGYFSHWKPTVAMKTALLASRVVITTTSSAPSATCDNLVSHDDNSGNSVVMVWNLKYTGAMLVIKGRLLLTSIDFKSQHRKVITCPRKGWDEITYPLPNVNDCAIEVWECISNVILNYYNDYMIILYVMITYPCWECS